MDLKTKLETTTKNHQASIQNLEAKFDRFANKQSGRSSGSLPSSTQHNPNRSNSISYIDVIDEILEEDFDAILDEGSEILHSIEGTFFEEKLFAEFDEFMIKTSLEEPPTDLELQPLPDNFEYAFLEEPSFLLIMEKTMKRYGVNHRFSTSYHPQTSGQVENTNRALKRILEKTVKDNPGIWSRKIDDALWAFPTAFKTPTGTRSYKIVYSKNCHLSFEIEYRAYMHTIQRRTSLYTDSNSIMKKKITMTKETQSLPSFRKDEL
ncbi:reverse transcriptase domain-containing protein [Tanacetum coccineum]|uniref:Reverse transcriptase domain-containing protein n=1 Tax=Tanacetum coccineum TaxID=301880 RepID=A0ABQ5AD30_9ASTR